MKNFVITCSKCGNTEVELTSEVDTGYTSGEGEDGEEEEQVLLVQALVYAKCKCGNEEKIYDNGWQPAPEE